MSIEVFGKTIQGKRRKQEDNIFYQTRSGVGMAVVCDGMGGLTDGDWASHIAVQLMKKHFNKRQSIDNIPNFYYKEIHHLDEVICRLEDEKNNQIIAGTTYVSAVIEENNLYWASVGDSKIYIFSNNSLNCVTRAHNYKLRLDDELARGVITKEQYDNEQKRAECLISYLGVGNLEFYDISNEPYILSDGDMVILCSDGVSNCLTEEEIFGVINNCTTVCEIVEQIITKIEIKDLKGQDNASLIVMRYRAS
ncbi:MAG: serine/threonine-protein phosphatase [Lachnospiraceae bacterium]|nr:serine/threonine-protein phosphatase [Lachnospiraceae bacterium]